MKFEVHAVRRSIRTLLSLLPAVCSLAPGISAAVSNDDAIGGLQVSYSTPREGAEIAADLTVLPNLSLYVPAGGSPTPFLESKPFKAVWDGFLNVDIRSSYKFQAELNGELRLEINGQTVLEVTGNGGETSASKLVRLSKGTNRIAASFSSPVAGDAWLRVHWIPRNGLPEPIPRTALSHAPSSELAVFSRVRLGRTVFLEHRCANCHTIPGSADFAPELAMDAPSFEGIGSRLNPVWMRNWILNPRSIRSAARMPRMFHGEDAEENASAVSAYLATLTTHDSPSESTLELAIDTQTGESLFNKLRCTACHVAPDSSSSDATLIPLRHVTQKFRPEQLEAFLQKPETHFAWIRMPNFKLTADEADQLAAFLRSHAEQTISYQESSNVAPVNRGRQLVQTTGCLNCHSLSVENHFTSRPLIALEASGWNEGCLADTPDDDSRTPYFAFSKTEVEALQAFAKSNHPVLLRHGEVEFAQRQIQNLRCAGCHSQLEGIPPLEILGGKLKPEWAEQFIAGRVAYKPRHWIQERMPSFGAYAEGLAHGMAMEHGFPRKTFGEPEIDQIAAEIGRRLVASDGGFSCISCHSIGKIGATAVFESPGINFAYATERLLKSYFTRWILNPLGVDPTSKMPVYFDEQGRSPLIDIYGGDGPQQLDALWEYMRLGTQMAPPPGLSEVR